VFFTLIDLSDAHVKSGKFHLVSMDFSKIDYSSYSRKKYEP